MIPEARLRPWILAAVMACAACGAAPSQKIMLDIPAPAAIRADQVEAVFLTNFWLPEEVKGLDLGRELREYWASELAVHFKRPAVERQVRFESDAAFSDAGLWKSLAGGASRSLILTGRVTFSQETHKALVEVDKGSVGEPFSREKTWDVRVSFTLQAHLYLISGETGLVVKDKELKETISYPNPKQPPLFALHDLLLRLKMKFFRDALGAPRLQERYLLAR